ncbi:MAG: chemotaxis response regulator protein-glutamate methylesterase [Gammaproteobacteria bacterium]|nr:chemotaxis response regulator protein-glutamate methylesterase [Gammaproteobacteria bacterium]MDH5593714.1 chemotaxis response regulator protein-glutamate methylesterase [Gammaproteobacteria bacterium]MDH5613782.1 chemotaxis response regulator protein-glutamate methylesterase [Gammaproteobacteria bacterium]
MAIRVLVVDDSAFFRKIVSEILGSDAGIEVVGTANDGKEAIERTLELKPDVITMDIEMPVMDGITSVKKIMAVRPTSILMFSTLTTDGAKATLDALDAGAADFLPKRFEDISKNKEEAKRLLCERVRILGGKSSHVRTRAAPVVEKKETPSVPKTVIKAPSLSRYDIVAIGTSTGGPVALQEVLTKLPADYPLPVLLIQHMPASFTPSFAQRLNQQCEITIKEAVDGDVLKPGTAYLAPGGKQMTIEDKKTSKVIRITESQPGQTYKPSVDITFKSIADTKSMNTLALILTGMGADGCEGARELKQNGATVWAQDEESCVVYGMPAAVAKAGLVDMVLPLSHIGETLKGTG